MPTMADFTDFVKSTAPAWASSKEAFINELQENSYPLRRFLKGRGMDELFQNGERIKDGIILDEAGTFQMVGPESESTWSNAQTLTVWEIPWRFAQCHMSWVDQEVDLSEGSSATNWKKVKRIKQTGLANDCVNGTNGKLFQKPDKTKMETFSAIGASDSGDPGEPYSIPALVNEQTDTLFASQTTTAPGGAWTTVQTIDPTIKTRWKNVQKSYSSITALTSGNITTAFDDIVQDLEFQMPGTMNEYFENTNMFRQVIWTTKRGINEWKLLCRAENDVNVSPNAQDPSWSSPKYAGIPLERAPQLETETLYGTSGAGVVESSTTNNSTGPRYYFINANFMKMAFHSKWYFKYMDVFSPEKNRNKHILPIQTWFNLYATSRRHHGIVYPASDL